MATALVEITSGIVRVWTEDNASFGTPFDFTLHFSGDEGCAILKGLRTIDQSLTTAHQKAIFDALRDPCGFKKVIWRRRDETGEPIRTIRIRL